ncbi:hypothetical protein RIF29_18272 [Crotalaria pallida]|uniref:Uncharacterized protein n=1 Tax=Crotalaria pallida TaxID=3830 RepID=A0AAN9FIL0_CROPI
MPKKILKGGGRSRSVEHVDLLSKIPTRPRTPMRSCTLNTASCASFATPKRPLFSLTLKKEEIEEDFLMMTGELPKKALKEAKECSKAYECILLNKVKPENYKVPDPSLKLASSLTSNGCPSGERLGIWECAPFRSQVRNLLVESNIIAHRHRALASIGPLQMPGGIGPPGLVSPAGWII